MEWISVKDKLPEDYCRCLITKFPVYGGAPFVEMSFYFKDRSVALESNPNYSRKRQGKETVLFVGVGGDSRVTHWMPLPAPPTEYPPIAHLS